MAESHVRIAAGSRPVVTILVATCITLVCFTIMWPSPCNAVRVQQHADIVIRHIAQEFPTESGTLVVPPASSYATTNFGAISVFDTPLLSFDDYPGPTAARLQGFGVFDSNSRQSVTLSAALVFTNSTSFPAGARINIQGTVDWPNVAGEHMELTSAASIVGGTGPLRFAKGFVFFSSDCSDPGGQTSITSYIFLSGNAFYPSFDYLVTRNASARCVVEVAP